MQDVKYLLNSHAHYDHCGGLAELKRVDTLKRLSTKLWPWTIGSAIPGC
jgi:glyoxylase-like metal-dependent hydrolase (beta-lactamase superfamily II)